MNILDFGQSRPFFDPAKCLNRIQRKHTCTVCTEQCPRGVFSLNAGDALRWDRCTDCNLCVAACPSRCFTASARRQKRLKEELNLKEPVSFGCRREETLCTVRMRCLTAVPWELIDACALYTDVVLYTGVCENCPEEGQRQAVSELLGRLERFLGEERFGQRVHLLREGRFTAAEPASAAENAVTRRALFSGVGRKLKSKAYLAAAQSLPFLEETETDGMYLRKLLAKAVQAETERDPSFRAGVELPQFTSRCTGYGICEKICPQKAIELGPEEAGGRMVYLTPWKCTACGLCALVCPYGGMEGLHTVRVPRMTQLALVRIHTK